MILFTANVSRNALDRIKLPTLFYDWNLSASDAVLQCLTREAFPLKAETKATEASLDVARVLLVSWRKRSLKTENKYRYKASQVYDNMENLNYTSCPLLRQQVGRLRRSLVPW